MEKAVLYLIRYGTLSEKILSYISSGMVHSQKKKSVLYLIRYGIHYQKSCPVSHQVRYTLSEILSCISSGTVHSQTILTCISSGMVHSQKKSCPIFQKKSCPKSHQLRYTLGNPVLYISSGMVHSQKSCPISHQVWYTPAVDKKIITTSNH